MDGNTALISTETRQIDENLIQEITRTIVEAFHPNRVILFGSRARGDHRPDSDIDIFVEMEAPGKRYERRIQIGQLFPLRWWAMDILTYTPAEVAERRDSYATLVPSIEQEGRLLYQRPNGS